MLMYLSGLYSVAGTIFGPEDIKVNKKNNRQAI